MNSFSKDELVTLLTNAGFIAYEYNISDKVVRGVGAFEKVCGYSAEEFNNSDIHWWTNHMHPEELALNHAVQIKILAQGGVYRGEYRIRTKSGEYVLVRDEGFASGKDENTKLSTRMAGLISRVHPDENLVPPETL